MEIEANDALKEMVLYSYDVIPYITEQLWMNRNYNTSYVGKSIRALSCTNKLFHDYYSAENNQQKIIRTIARNNYETDESAALILKFHAISEKIKYFINIAKNKDGRFTQEDLKEKWYLKVTDVCSKSLARIAIESNNFEVAQLIINHLELDLTCKELSCLSDVIFWKIRRDRDDKNIMDRLKIIHSNLQKKILLRQ